MRIPLTASLAGALLISASAHAARFTGQVVDDEGRPVIGAEVSVGAAHAATGADGAFVLDAPDAAVYTLRAAADGHYAMLHAFADHELADGRTLAVPPITLTARAPDRTLFVFGGDFMMGRRYEAPFAGEPRLLRAQSRRADAEAVLATVKPYLELADYASVNLESVVSRGAPAERAPKSVTFYTRPEAVDALAWAGVDYVTLGNNHLADYRNPGVERTLAAVDRADIAHSGAGMGETEALSAHVEPLGGTDYALLGYVGWEGGFTPNQVAEGEAKGGSAYGSLENVVASVAREQGAGHAPIVQIHGGLEYADGPTGSMETRTKAAIDAGARLAVNHHPHVLQGFEIYDGALIAYSLGNFSFDQYHYATQESALLYVWMDAGRFHRAEVAPMHVRDYRSTPATGAMRRAVLTRLAELSRVRGVALTPTGAHAEIRPLTNAAIANGVVAAPTPASADREVVAALTSLPWNASPVGVAETGGADARVRLGRDLIHRGDFEPHAHFGTHDRSWIEDDGFEIVETPDARSGRNAARLPLSGGKSVAFGQRTFENTYTSGAAASAVAHLNVDTPVRVDVYLQRRPSDWPRGRALEEGPRIPIGAVRVDPGGWRQIALPFDMPRVGTTSVRLLMAVTPLDANASGAALIDDVALIEWATPFLSAGDAARLPVANRITHVGVSGAAAAGEARLEISTVAAGSGVSLSE